MNVHVLQHVPFEDIGSMAFRLSARGANLAYTRLYEEAELPTLDGIDLLIAMGGPMSVNDEAALPWLRAEKALLREAVARGIPVLGVCLGAQLIAAALGARVYPNPEKEIGWFPIRAVFARCRAGGRSLPVSSGGPGIPLAWRDLRSAARGGSIGGQRGLPKPGLSDRTAGHRPSVSSRDHARERGGHPRPLPRRAVAGGLDPIRGRDPRRRRGLVCRGEPPDGEPVCWTISSTGRVSAELINRSRIGSNGLNSIGCNARLPQFSTTMPWLWI
jgi:hypothetical protein